MRNKNLKIASKDIEYEIDMFRITSDRLCKRNLPGFSLSIFMQNALLESFAIHTRNLVYFFYTSSNFKRRKPDDIIAEDYLLKKNYFIKNRTKKSSLNYILKKVAKQIAHLTYHRAVYNKSTKAWKVQDIRIKIDKTINAFINSLSDEQKKWFKLEKNLDEVK